MDYCSGGDLSFYIKKRGRLPTLEYVPQSGGKEQYWPHPEEGGLDEIVVRCFLGQLGEFLTALPRKILLCWKADHLISLR
jgi:serine/threonine-protein kinase ULK/ATG1